MSFNDEPNDYGKNLLTYVFISQVVIISLPVSTFRMDLCACLFAWLAELMVLKIACSCFIVMLDIRHLVVFSDICVALLL